MTPVIMLSDSYLANGTEPWRIPAIDELEPIPVNFHTDTENFMPYSRDKETLARPWAVPGTPGLTHIVGGLESEDLTGFVNYYPENHERMVRLRAEKIAGIVRDIPPLTVHGNEEAGDLLVVGWGSSFGVIWEAVDQAVEKGLPVASIHLRHLNPFPPNLGDILQKFSRVLVVEMNMGQLAYMLQADYLLKVERLCKVQGQPFQVHEVYSKLEEMCRRAA